MTHSFTCPFPCVYYFQLSTLEFNLFHIKLAVNSFQKFPIFLIIIIVTNEKIKMSHLRLILSFHSLFFVDFSSKTLKFSSF